MGTFLKYLSICLVAFLCYYNTLFGSFVFDDSEAIVKNKDINPTTPILDIFKNDFWGTDITLNKSHKSYRPLTIITYRLNFILAGSKLNALHFHATNLILYMILCLMTIPLFKLFLNEKEGNLSYYASLLFTVHPIHTEAVAGLVGRADILSSILFILSVLLYEKVLIRNSIAWFVVTILTIGMAVLCKETSITALGVCIVYDILKSNILQEHSNWKLVVMRIFVLFTSALVIFYFRLWIMNFEGPTFTSIDNPAAYCDNLFTRIFTYNYIYCLNILLLIWPKWLCFDWSMGCIPLIQNTDDVRILCVLSFWLGLFVIASIILYKIYHKKSCESVILGLGMMVIPFIPASNLFFKVGFVIAERTLLLPSIGYCLLIVLGYFKINKFLGIRNILYFDLILLYGIYSIRTIERNVDWLSEKNLFLSAIDVCPLNAKVHYNIGKVAADEKNKVLAMQEYNIAIELNPNYEQAMNNLANILREDKHFEEAEILLRKAVKIRPNFAAAWMNLGIVLTNLNKLQEAELCYLKAISYRNKYPDCYYNLGNLYLDIKDNEKALAAWQKAVFYKPTHTAAWSNTLVLLDSLKQFDKALKLGKTALNYNPNSAALYFSLANTLGKMQQFEKAEVHFMQAINLNPHNALYFSNLGVLYHRWGKRDKAIDMYKKALELDPNLKTTEINLLKLSNNEK